jgi:CBS domain-containing protein
MVTVEKLLQVKGNKTWTITPQATVYVAVQLMSDKNIGALMVMEAQKPVGIFTERDYARKLILKGKSSKTTTVRELMTVEVLYVVLAN